MSLFPINVRAGKATYSLEREPDDQLKLSCVTTDNPELVISIVFPQNMVLELARRAVSIHMRLNADTETARMFPQLHQPVPAWPADPFDDR